MIRGILKEEDLGVRDRLLGYALKLVRRDIATTTTVDNIRRLSTPKLHRLTRIAHTMLSEFERGRSDAKMLEIRTVQRHVLTIKIPCGNQRTARSGCLHAIRSEF